MQLDSINGPDKQQDVLHLTKLTNLQRLYIHDAWGVDDTATTAIVHSLTQLSHLELPECYITSGDTLREIAQLPLLAVLNITDMKESSDDGSCLQDEDIEVLLPLPKLRDLFADGTFSEEAIQRFYDA